MDSNTLLSQIEAIIGRYSELSPNEKAINTQIIENLSDYLYELEEYKRKNPNINLGLVGESWQAYQNICKQLGYNYDAANALFLHIIKEKIEAYITDNGHDIASIKEDYEKAIALELKENKELSRLLQKQRECGHDISSMKAKREYRMLEIASILDIDTPLSEESFKLANIQKVDVNLYMSEDKAIALCFYENGISEIYLTKLFCTYANETVLKSFNRVLWQSKGVSIAKHGLCFILKEPLITVKELHYLLPFIFTSKS